MGAAAVSAVVVDGIGRLVTHTDVGELTDAYVVPYRGRELGIEFRTVHDEDVRSRMLKSFHFLEVPR